MPDGMNHKIDVSICDCVCVRVIAPGFKIKCISHVFYVTCYLRDLHACVCVVCVYLCMYMYVCVSYLTPFLYALRLNPYPHIQ